jgi:hypothetical protein
MTKEKSGHAAKAVVASILALGLAAQAGVASAQDYGPGGPPPPGDYGPNGPPPSGDYGPPQGQYAPPPEGASPDQAYSAEQQQRDQAYGQAYSDWAARYCVQRRENNAAAGAVIGGVLGAIVGGGLAGRGNHTAGAFVGGAVGAGTGAAIGASSGGPQSSCPPGYVIVGGAPAFYYGGYVPVYGPGWYNPWIFVGGRWTYRPYRSWYWGHPGYWRPGWGHRRY